MAGLGTRLLPLTSVIPKELLPINGKIIFTEELTFSSSKLINKSTNFLYEFILKMPLGLANYINTYLISKSNSLSFIEIGHNQKNQCQH